MDEVRLGSRTLQPRRQLLVNGRRQPLGKRSLDILSLLADARGGIVTKDELLDAAWPGIVVEENALQAHVVALRKALGPEAGRLRTIRGVGYQLELDGPAPAESRVSIEASPRSLAVLPFANLTGDPTKDYLGDGMAEELIHRLGSASELQVPSRTSVFAYKDRNIDIRQIARDLGVRTVLEGSVRAAGRRIRVTAKLVEAESGFQLWSATYDQELADLFELQDALAGAIAAELHSRLLPQSSPSRDVGAYQLFLQASELLDRHGRANVEHAIALLREATDRDPGFARAHGRLAYALNEARHLLQGSEDLLAIRLHAERAIALDASLAEAQEAILLVNSQTGNWLGAAAAYTSAVEAKPNDPLTELNAATFLHMPLGCMTQARLAARRAVSLAPRSAAAQLVSCLSAIAQGDFGEATAQFASRMVELDFPTDRPPGSAVLGSLAFRAGRLDEASALMKASFPPALREAGDRLYDLVFRAVRGEPAAPALAAMAQLLAKPAYAEPLTATLGLHSSLIYWGTVLGGLDIAFAAAERVIASWRKTGVLTTVDLYPVWYQDTEAFRADPRFQQFVEALGMFPYWERYGPPDGYALRSDALVRVEA